MTPSQRPFHSYKQTIHSMSDGSIADEDTTLRVALTDIETKLASLTDWTWDQSGSNSEQPRKRLVEHGEFVLGLVRSFLNRKSLDARSASDLSANLSKTINPHRFSILGSAANTVDGRTKFAADPKKVLEPSTRAVLEAEVNQLIDSVDDFDSVVTRLSAATQGE